MAGQKKPNFLFILIDDLRFDACGYMNHQFSKTPNIDYLAKNGAVLSNCFCTTSLCSPSRASLLTGQYAFEHGVYKNETIELAEDKKTFPMILQSAGYKTAHIGKWHMGPTNNPRPGFGYWLSFKGQGKYDANLLNINNTEIMKTGYITDVLTDYAAEWLENNKSDDKPFCMTIGHKAVHEPFTPAERHKTAYSGIFHNEPKSWGDNYSTKPECQRKLFIHGASPKEIRINQHKVVPPKLENREWKEDEWIQKNIINYYRTLLAVDESVGRIVDKLKSLGKLDSTIIMFAGDNGYFWGEHKLHDKRWAYDESLRIPFIVYYPNGIKPGTVVDEMTLTIDFAPTLLEYANIKIPDNIQGKSWKRLVEGGKESLRGTFFYEYYQEEFYPGIPTIHAVRTKEWKYITYPKLQDIEELYDLISDPHEMNNLVFDPYYGPKRDQMNDELERLKKEIGYIKKI